RRHTRSDRDWSSECALPISTRTGQVAAAVLHVVQQEASFTRAFGKAQTEQAMFLLGSISKPITVTALMTLFERGEFKLDDRLQRSEERRVGKERRFGAVGRA